MFEWQEFRLGDVTEWSSGGTPSKRNDTYWSGQIPWISASSMRGNRYSDSDLKITDAGLKVGSRLAKKDSILLLVRGSTLHQRILVGISTCDVAFNQDVKCIVPNEEYLDSWYLLFWFMSIEKELLNMVENTGIGAGKLETKLLQNLIIKIPPKEERERIKACAKAIDDKLILNRQTNQTLEQIAQAIFKSWFVDFEPVKAKIQAKQALNLTLSQKEREAKNPLPLGEDLGEGDNNIIERAAMCAISCKTDAELDQLNSQQYQQLATTAALFPDAMQESELGEIPEGWGIQTLEDVVELSYGKALKKTDRVGGNFPVYGSGGLTGTHNKSLVKEPGIVVGRKGTVGALYWEDKSFFPIDTVFYVKCKNDMTLVYAYYLLQTLGLEDMNTDAAVPGLNRNNAYRLEIPKVPIELISTYSTLIESIRKKNLINQKEAYSLETIRDTLLPKLLSGELSLTPVDIKKNAEKEAIGLSNA